MILSYRLRFCKTEIPGRKARQALLVARLRTLHFQPLKSVTSNRNRPLGLAYFSHGRLVSEELLDGGPIGHARLETGDSITPRRPGIAAENRRHQHKGSEVGKPFCGTVLDPSAKESAGVIV